MKERMKERMEGRMYERKKVENAGGNREEKNYKNEYKQRVEHP